MDSRSWACSGSCGFGRDWPAGVAACFLMPASVSSAKRSLLFGGMLEGTVAVASACLLACDCAGLAATRCLLVSACGEEAPEPVRPMVLCPAAGSSDGFAAL